jgi:hypothetical protein
LCLKKWPRRGVAAACRAGATSDLSCLPDAPASQESKQSYRNTTALTLVTEGPRGGAVMRAIGYVTICATIGGILALSTPFTERRSIKTWAPNVVVAAPKPAATVINAPQSPTAAVAMVDALKPSHVPETVVGRGEHTAAAQPATIGADPQETGALPKQAEAATREAPRPNAHAARKRPRESRPSQRLSRPQRAVAQIPAMPLRSSREPIQFRLAEGRH